MIGEERGDVREKYQYKDTYSEYRFIHLFGADINNEGVYEKGISTLRRRIDRLYDKIEQSNRITCINTLFRVRVYLFGLRLDFCLGKVRE